MSKPKDIKGQRFTKLLVLEYTGKSNHSRSSIWLCLCDCGNKVEVASHSLKNGFNKSCRCLLKEMLAKGINLQPFGQATFNKLVDQYKASAKSRDLVFEISEDFFKEIYKKDCFYCGSSPSNICRNKRNKNDFIVYNGLDRIDNSVGYVEGNVVPCCRDCNWAKGKMKPDVFKRWINKISSKLVIENLEEKYILGMLSL